MTNSVGETLISIAPRTPWRINYGLRSLLGELPDFLIMGFPKCGTTSLYNYLIQHPGVLHGDGKEQWYFSTFPLKPFNYYRFRYPFKIDKWFAKAKLRREFLLGDGTPDYVFRKESLSAIRKHLPDVKIIILMRDPVERSYSYYRHEKRSGRIKEQFDRLVEYEYENFKKNGIRYHEQLYDEPSLKDTFLLGSIYVRYLDQLAQYFSKEQVLLLNSEDLFANPKSVYDSVCEFLEIVPHEDTSFEIFNAGNYEADDIPSRDFLKHFYEPYNRQLREKYDFEADWVPN